MWININKKDIPLMNYLIWNYPELVSKEFTSDSIFIEDMTKNEWTKFEIEETGIDLTYISKEIHVVMSFTDGDRLLCVVKGDIC